MIYGYIRVSSDKQTVENQRFEINKFCERQNIMINDGLRKPSVERRITTSVNWVIF